MLLALVLTPLLLAPLVALLPPPLRHRSWLLAVVPALLFAALLAWVPAVSSGQVLRERTPWISSIGLDLSFTLDGLSLLFALLITGIGTLIVLYTAGYLDGEARAFVFHGYLLLFMGAMLGLVLAANALALFVFWELTSVSSFLLVGFMYRAPAARAAARMALVVTAGGGLALLGGLLLLGQVVGSYELAAAVAAGAAVRGSPLYGAILALVALGCFTKSAQVPFHFWLPGAMAAPTPASAYLHSATMVKAGIYLLARLSPCLGGTDAWLFTMSGVGIGTLVLGSFAALIQSDLKAILAYSTVAQLGAFTALIGLGSHGAKALMVGILGHALYKATLFMASGNVQHITHTRDIGKLGGLARAMPATCAAVVLAALSMAGLPPLLGFLAKEKLLEALLDHDWGLPLLLYTVGGAAIAALLTVTIALRFCYETFVRPRAQPYDHAPHEAEPLLLAGPLLLATCSLLLVFLPGVGVLLGAAAATMGAAATPVPLASGLWAGVTPPLLLSVLAIGLGLALFAARSRVLPALVRLVPPLSAGALFERGMVGLQSFARRVSRPTETLRLRQSVLLVFLAMSGLGGWGLLRWVPPPSLRWEPLPLPLVVVMLLIPLSAVATVVANTRLKAITALGIAGAMISLLFALFSAPDLALTQLLVETLSLVFMLVAFARLPQRLVEQVSRGKRVRDVAVATLAGVVVFGMVMAATAPGGFDSIAPFYIANSLALANGANVVNVILVDFRGYDTLGEITVLCTAALGAYAVLRAGRLPHPPVPGEERGMFADVEVAAVDLVDGRLAVPLVIAPQEAEEPVR